MGCLGEYGACIIEEVLEQDRIRYRFIGSIDRIVVLPQAFAVIADMFIWVRFDGLQIARVDGALGLGIGSVELVPERDPHLGWILHTTELFLDRTFDGETKDGFHIIFSLLEGFDGKLKVGKSRRCFDWLLFLASDDFPSSH